MNVKAFCTILEEVAAFQRSVGADVQAEQIDAFVARLKPFHRRQLAELFIVPLANRESSQSSSPQGLSAFMLGKVLMQTARLLRSAGANAKASELEETSRQASKLGALPAESLADAINERDEAAVRETVTTFVTKLNAAERNSGAFESVVQEVGKLNAQLAIRVAAGYVQGRPTYPSRPKALKAIRDKQYADERFRHKTGKS